MPPPAMPATLWTEAPRSWSALGIADLAAEVAAALRLPVASQGERIAGALRRAVLGADLLAPAHTRPGSDCYARHVLHADEDGRFTILALAWAPGQGSPVHAHRTWCAFAVRQGMLRETLFAFDRTAPGALAMAEHERQPGYAAFAPPGLERGHRLVNAGPETAVSIHVYGVGGDRIATDVNAVFDFA